LSSALGGAFGAVVALISPEFVASVRGFTMKEAPGIVRYAFALGMIWGLFIGGAASGFACFLAAVIKIIKVPFARLAILEADRHNRRRPYDPCPPFLSWSKEVCPSQPYVITV
jgi:hypothetical protein